jgi:hypothetical protein
MVVFNLEIATDAHFQKYDLLQPKIELTSCFSFFILGRLSMVWIQHWLRAFLARLSGCATNIPFSGITGGTTFLSAFLNGQVKPGGPISLALVLLTSMPKGPQTWVVRHKMIKRTCAILPLLIGMQPWIGQPRIIYGQSSPGQGW